LWRSLAVAGERAPDFSQCLSNVMAAIGQLLSQSRNRAIIGQSSIIAIIIA
jgi:hypothetical protein